MLKQVAKCRQNGVVDVRHIGFFRRQPQFLSRRGETGRRNGVIETQLHGRKQRSVLGYDLRHDKLDGFQ